MTRRNLKKNKASAAPKTSKPTNPTNPQARSGCAKAPILAKGFSSPYSFDVVLPPCELDRAVCAAAEGRIDDLADFAKDFAAKHEGDESRAMGIACCHQICTVLTELLDSHSFPVHKCFEGRQISLPQITYPKNCFIVIFF